MNIRPTFWIKSNYSSLAACPCEAAPSLEERLCVPLCPGLETFLVYVLEFTFD